MMTKSLQVEIAQSNAHVSRNIDERLTRLQFLYVIEDLQLRIQLFESVHNGRGHLGVGMAIGHKDVVVVGVVGGHLDHLVCSGQRLDQLTTSPGYAGIHVFPACVAFSTYTLNLY